VASMNIDNKQQYKLSRLILVLT